MTELEMSTVPPPPPAPPVVLPAAMARAATGQTRRDERPSRLRRWRRSLDGLRGWRTVRRRFPPRKVALVLLVVVAAVVVTETLVAGAMFRQRQHQLAADFKTPRPFSAQGRAIAVLQIPSIGMNLTVAEGAEADVLRGGPGHLATTPVPGSPGNSVVLAHDRRFGGPFGSLGRVSKGDPIYVQPKGTSEVVSYVVDSIDKVDADKIDALAPVDGTQLTLVTSAGGWLSTDRLVVRATAEKASAKYPPATRPSAAPDRFGPSDSVVNGRFLLALAWLVIAASVLRYARSRYPRVVVAAVTVPPVLLGAALLWLQFGRVLPGTF